ncbi:hypothetical protein JAAARDRAFT_55699 [Jaapia argillacea MUCL 33604]|uniref:CTLH/CRA C-terminal to LisH motif domain-containing protein n=1 Tax=Jaapia argillacea MUCL 33604 TaxID=933084 RepID=A0A067QEF7_9AGAM|nr:hypothetical protein JAAARDRAFT_55699 [Jaapia argillacea MUCL 33604]
MSNPANPWASKKPLPNSHFLNPVPQHLRALVLDYLFHNCYTNTAKAFARDSAVRQLDADGDEVMLPAVELEATQCSLSEESLRLVELRQDVRTHILSGRIDEAITLLNDHFPAVLCQDGETLSQDRTPSPASGSFLYVRSLQPIHLFLNLRVQAFIEAIRTVPLPYPHPCTTTSSESSPPPNRDPEEHKFHLIQLARKLVALAKSLPNPVDRQSYDEELNCVIGLLGYPIPEESSVANYLSQKRREAVADQINSAILLRTGHRSVSQIELCTRYNSVIWSFLHDLHIRLPPVESRPPGVRIPLAGSSGGDKQPTSIAHGSEPESIESPPPFDLNKFLSS